MEDIKKVLQALEGLRDELFPLANRGAMLYSVIRSLSAICPEYQFSYPYFLTLFDEIVGDAFPDGYKLQMEEVYRGNL